MKEYIEKQAAINMLCSKCSVDTPDSCSTIQRGDNWCEEVYYLLKTPVADVVPVVHAYWKDNKNGTVSCSRCSTWFQKERVPYLRFCGYCGAKMDGRKRE